MTGAVVRAEHQQLGDAQAKRGKMEGGGPVERFVYQPASGNYVRVTCWRRNLDSGLINLTDTAENASGQHALHTATTLTTLCWGKPRLAKSANPPGWHAGR